MDTSGVAEGSILGKYRMIAEIGRGGMADVYLAVAQGPGGFNKLVVIKERRGQLAQDPEFLTMFLDEARIAARLNHPNIVQTNSSSETRTGVLKGKIGYMAPEQARGERVDRCTDIFAVAREVAGVGKRIAPSRKDAKISQSESVCGSLRLCSVPQDANPPAG